MLELAASAYLGTAIGVVTGPILARSLGPELRGELAAIATSAECLLVFLTLGMPDAVGSFAASGRSSVDELLRAAKRYSAMTLPFSIAGAWGLLAGPLGGLSSEGTQAAIALFLLTPFGIYLMSVEQALRAAALMRPLAQLRVIPMLIHGVMVMGFWAASALGLWVVVCAKGIGTMLALGVGRSHVPSHAGESVSIRRLLSFGGRTQIGRLAGFGNVRLDHLLLFAMSGAEALGHYAVATTVSGLSVGVSDALASRAFGQIGAAARSDRRAVIVRTLKRAILPLLFAGLLLESIGPIGIRVLFGQEFEPAVGPLRILVPGFVLFGWGQVAAACGLALGHASVFMSGQLLGLLVTITLLPLFVPRYGAIAAATISAVSFAVIAASSGILLLRAVRAEMATEAASH